VPPDPARARPGSTWPGRDAPVAPPSKAPRKDAASTVPQAEPQDSGARYLR